MADIRRERDPLADINKNMHKLTAESPRGQMFNLMKQQRTNYNPFVPTGQALVDRRHSGRQLTPYQQMPNPSLPDTVPFSRRGSGRAYVPRLSNRMQKPALALGREA